MNILKKQGVAWVIAIVMIVAAIGIGRARADGGDDPSGVHDLDRTPDAFFVYDDAGVLSADEEEKLSARNRDLYSSMGVVIACVTTNYGRDDLYSFAMDYAEDIGLGANDFIVVLDISGENYWLIQGIGIAGLFTDDDCSDYAYGCMERDFAAGRYGDALLELTSALESWYYDN